MDGFDESLGDQLLQAFREESSELLEAIGQSLVRAEHAEQQQKVADLRSIRQNLHTLKGAAAAVGMNEVKDTCHALEDTIDQLADDDPETADELVGLINDKINFIEAILAGQDPGSELIVEEVGQQKEPSHEDPELETTFTPQQPESEEQTEQSEAQSAESSPANPRTSGPTTIRVQTDRIENVQASVGELVTLELRQQQLEKELKQLRDRFNNVVGNWRTLNRNLEFGNSTRSKSNGTRSMESLRNENRVEQFDSDLKAVYGEVYALSSETTSLRSQLERLSNRFQDDVQRMRLMKAGPYLESFSRVALTAARSLGKKVKLEVEDHDIEVDRFVLDNLREVFIHLIRNAVAHGIEMPEQRLEVGKPEVGEIVLESTVRGDYVYFTIFDDGGGIDLDAIRSKAEQLRLIEPGQELSNEIILNVLTHSGFSTSRAVNDVSGRGIGMDVVRRNLQDMRGELSLNTIPGEGTSYTLKVPTSLSNVDGLIIATGEYRFGLPLGSVDRMLRIRNNEIKQTGTDRYITWNDEPITVVEAADLLNVEERGERESEMLPIVILSSGDRKLALLVDEVIGEMPFFLKSIGEQFERHPHFAGGTVMPDGSVLVVLNPQELIDRSSGISSLSLHSSALGADDGDDTSASPRILVVDDSVTTRTLEQNILSSFGYDVSVALDGVEALAKIESQEFDLIITDYEMPRMDGVELVKNVRDNVSRNIPIIMVTSLSQEERRNEGLQAGVNDYIIKGNFSQEHFIETVQKYI